jgi:hypothetical protein
MAWRCAGAGELGVHLNHVANIDDQQEGRPTFDGRQRGHSFRPVRELATRIVEATGLSAQADLFGFKHETGPTVTVNAALAARAVAARQRDATLENVSVFTCVLAGRFRVGNADQIGELQHEKLIVGELSAVGVLPTINELGCLLSKFCGGNHGVEA